MEGKLIFLGSGASMGVPVIGCQCAVCRSDSPYNKRMRPSVLIKVEQKQFVIDVGPDFRAQALRQGISHINGILFTHAHQDHTAGIDDLRPLFYRQASPIPILASEETAKDIKARFHFIFKSNAENPTFVPRLKESLLPSKQGKVVFEGIEVGYSTFVQGGMGVNGYRIGDMAYLTDIKHYDEGIFEWLKGVKTLIVSALRISTSPLHLSVPDAVVFADKVAAQKVWLTHTSHDLEYEKTNASLPAHVQLAYDGLEVEFNLENYEDRF